MTPQEKIDKIKEEIKEFTRATNAGEEPDTIYLIEEIENIVNAK